MDSDTHRETVRQTSGKTEGQTDRWVDRQMGRQTGGRTKLDEHHDQEGFRNLVFRQRGSDVSSSRVFLKGQKKEKKKTSGPEAPRTGCKSVVHH